MTTEGTKQGKKPPAHEVIVALLQQYAQTVQREARNASHNPETAASLVIVEQQASALVTVLMRMHIPEKDWAAIVDGLHNLPREFLNADILAEIEGDAGGA